MTRRGEQLIRELLADPERFSAEGRSYDLLQEYFSGFPLHTLRELLRSKNLVVQREATFVAVELGTSGCELVSEVVPLVSSSDTRTAYHAMEMLTVCALGVRAGDFVHVIKMLESPDEVLRALAMYLASNAQMQQLEASAKSFPKEVSEQTFQRHKRPLLALARGSNPEDVRTMMESADGLVRRYGAIAVVRGARAGMGERVLSLLASVRDPDIRRFAARVLDHRD